MAEKVFKVFRVFQELPIFSGLGGCDARRHIREKPAASGLVGPWYLADALEIGSTLCLSDGLTPGVCRHPSGRFCLIMRCRITGEVADVGGKAAGAEAAMAA